MDKENLSLLDYFRLFFTNPAKFVKSEILNGKSRCINSVVFLIGVAAVFERMYSKNIDINFLRVNFWLALIVGAIISGGLSFIIRGGLYKLRVKWSRDKRYDLKNDDENSTEKKAGEDEQKHEFSNEVLKSHNLVNIWAYMTLPYALAMILLTLFKELLMPILGSTIGNIFLKGFFIVYAAAILYGIVLGYIIARKAFKTVKWKSIIWLLVLPIMFYTAVIGGMYAYSLYIERTNNEAIRNMQTGNYDKAEENMHEALEFTKKEDKAIAYGNLGLIYENKGEYDKAKEQYEKALEYLNPMQADYFATQGKIQLIDGDIDAAIKSHEKALDINPKSFDANNLLGLIYLGEYDDDSQEFTNYEKALKHNKAAYEYNRDGKTMAYNLGLNYYALEEYDEAKKYIQEYLGIEGLPGPMKEDAEFFLKEIESMNK